MKVKLGALTVRYTGTAEFIELDRQGRSLVLQAKGREKTGFGTAQMEMTSRVHDAEDGSRIEIDAEVKLSGKLVGMGRGMIGVVADQLLEEFAARLGEELAAAGSGESGIAERRGEDPPSSDAAPDHGAGDQTKPEPEALSGLGLLMRALRRWLAGLFRG